MSTERIRPITSTERQRQSNEAHATTAEALHPQEIHTTSDQLRIFRKHVHLGPVDHGTVASALAMAALGTTATRGVWPGDTCWRSDEGVTYQCILGSDSAAVWRAVGVGSVELSSGLAAKADAGATASELAGKQSTLTNATTLGKITEASGVPRWNGSAWPGGGGSGWELLYSEDFASLANWVQVDGTWSVAGGVLTKTNTGSADLRLDLPSAFMLAECIVSVEVSLPGPTSVNTYYGVIGNWDGAAPSPGSEDSTLARFSALASSSTIADVSIDRTATELLAARVFSGFLTPPAVTAWTRLTFRMVGSAMSAACNDTPCCGARMNGGILVQPRYLGLRVGDGGTGQVSFRSFNLYVPAGM